MTENCRIRPYTSADFAAIDKIRKAAFQPIFASFRDIVGEEIAVAAFGNAEKEQAEHLRTICQPDSEHELYVAENGGEVIAFVSLSLNQETGLGEIGLSAAHPNHQKKGVGTRMFEFALERMRQAGMTAATVSTGADPSHAPARRAYEKAGFVRSIPAVHLYRSL